MKTREQLEKEFENKFLTKNWNFRKDQNPIEVRNYFFQELLPQVLSEIIPEDKNEYDDFNSGYNLSISRIKQKAKEMGINLPE